MHLATEPPPDKTPPNSTKNPANAIPLELGLSWSRASRLYLPEPKMAPRIKKAIQTALRQTFAMAIPLYPTLQFQLKNKGIHPGFELDFSFVDDAKIQDLNLQYRGKNQPTDVLSFALWEENPEENEAEFPFPLPGGHRLVALGDIVISTQTTGRQSLEQNHSFEREISFLTIHGALHLLGYDHNRDGARRQMFARQDAIFEAIFK